MAIAVSQSSEAKPESTASRASSEAASPQGWVVRIMQAEGPGLTRMLWRMLGREADVMDAYQDCFCKLATRAHRLNPRKARAYVYRTASNVALDLLRARARQEAHWEGIKASRTAVQEARTGTDQPDEELELRRAHLRQALSELPPHLQNVIVLRDLGQLPYEEVGRILKIDPTTARVYRRHAVVRLADLMQGEAS